MKLKDYLDEAKQEYEDPWEAARETHLKNVEATDNDYHNKKLSKDEYHTRMKKHSDDFHKDLDSRTSPERKKIVDKYTQRGKWD